MKVAVVSFKKELITKYLDYFAMELSENPEIVIVLGGDGSLLFSEMQYPGVPKLFLKHSSSCSDCSKHDVSKFLKMVIDGKYKIEEFIKIEAQIANEKMIALNDINIHYRLPMALRYEVILDDKQVDGEIIGDGVVVSTPYGSPAYFKSITGKTFKKGIGVAFNNPTKKMKPIIASENSNIKVRITRHDGYLAYDCSKRLIAIKTGDVINIRKHPENAKLIHLKGEELKILI